MQRMGQTPFQLIGCGAFIHERRKLGTNGLSGRSLSVGNDGSALQSAIHMGRTQWRKQMLAMNRARNYTRVWRSHLGPGALDRFCFSIMLIQATIPSYFTFSFYSFCSIFSSFLVFVCMSFRFNITLSFGLLVLIHPLTHTSIYLSIFLSAYLSIYLSAYLSIYPHIYLSIHPSAYLSIRLSIYPSIYLSVHLSIYLFSLWLLIVSFFFFASVSTLFLSTASTA
jgi:hypothetical protein